MTSVYPESSEPESSVPALENAIPTFQPKQTTNPPIPEAKPIEQPTENTAIPADPLKAFSSCIFVTLI